MDENHGTGLTHAQIANSYAVCPATITNTIQSYVKNGITDIIKYNISPNSSAALRKADGRVEAHLIQIACSPVPQGHSRWTLRLLEERCRVEIETPVSRETIRRVLKKNELRPHHNDYWCIPPKEDAEFIACMEDILDIYEMPYDPNVRLYAWMKNHTSCLGKQRNRCQCVQAMTKKWILNIPVMAHAVSLRL